MNRNIQVVWSRRPAPKGPSTTDEEGYYPYQFSFTDGRSITVEVKCDTVPQACAYQKVLFESPVYLTNVEVWTTRDGSVYIYAMPSNEVLEKLSKSS